MGQEFGNVRGMDAMTDGTDEFRLNSVAMEKTLPNPINKRDELFQAALNDIIELFGIIRQINPPQPKFKTNSAKVRKSFRRRKRNPVLVVKQNHSPEKADDFDVRCMGSDKGGKSKRGNCIIASSRQMLQ